MTDDLDTRLAGLLKRSAPLLEASESRCSVPHLSHAGRRVVGFKVVDEPDHFLHEPLDQLEALEQIASALPQLLADRKAGRAELALYQEQLRQSTDALAERREAIVLAEACAAQLSGALDDANERIGELERALGEIAREQSAKTATAAADRFQSIARAALEGTKP